MSASPALRVKARRGDEVRRFALAGDAAAASFAALADQLRALYAVAPRDALVVKYQDNEGDYVTVSTDIELAEAIRLCGGALLRLELTVRPAAAAAAAAPAPAGKAAAKPAAPAAKAAAKQAASPAKPAAAPAPAPAPTAPTQPAATPAPAPTAAAAVGSSVSTPTLATLATPGGPEGAPTAAPAPTAAKSEAALPVTAAAADPKAERLADKQRRLAEREQLLLAREAEKAARQAAKQAEAKRREEEKKEQLRRKMQEANEKGLTDAPEVHRQLLKAEIERLKTELKEAKSEAGFPVGKALMWARFVRDVTVPDGTVLRPQEAFTKTWRFRNELDKPWPAGTRLLFVGKNSDRLGAPDEVLIARTVQPGEETDVSVPLMAPAAPGRYTAYFRLATAEGKKFGQRVWVMISVGSAASHSSDEEADAAPAPHMPAAPAAPAIDPALLAQYEAQLATLAQLNFRNVAANVRLLRKWNGSLEEVVAVLMRRRAAKRAAAAATPAPVATDSTQAAPTAQPAIPSAALPLAAAAVDSPVVPIPVPPAAVPKAPHP